MKATFSRQPRGLSRERSSSSCAALVMRCTGPLPSSTKMAPGCSPAHEENIHKFSDSVSEYHDQLHNAGDEMKRAAAALREDATRLLACRKCMAKFSEYFSEVAFQLRRAGDGACQPGSAHHECGACLQGSDSHIEEERMLTFFDDVIQDLGAPRERHQLLV